MFTESFHGSLHKTSDTCYVMIFKNQYGTNVVEPKCYPSHSLALSAAKKESLASFLDYSSLSGEGASPANRIMYLHLNYDQDDKFFILYSEGIVKRLVQRSDLEIPSYVLFELHRRSSDLPSQISTTLPRLSSLKRAANYYAESKFRYLKAQFGNSNERARISLFFKKFPFTYEAEFEAGCDFKLQRSLFLW